MHRHEYDPCEQPRPVDEGSEARSRILHAAYPLFVEHGYDSVSMQGIADAVPLNKATLYHHFQSKDDLFLAVVRMAMSRLHTQILDFIAEGGSAADQLIRVAVQIFEDSQSEFGRLLTDARKNLSAEQQHLLTERCADPWNLYEAIFSSAVANHEIPPVDITLAATMFAGLIQGQTWALKLGRIDGPLDHARAAFLVDTLFAGLNSVASTPPRANMLRA